MGLIKQRGVARINRSVWHADVYMVKSGRLYNFSDKVELVELVKMGLGNPNKLLSEMNSLIYFKEHGITGNKYEDVREDARKLLDRKLKQYDYVVIGLWKESPNEPEPLECKCLMGIDDHGNIWMIENIFIWLKI